MNYTDTQKIESPTVRAANHHRSFQDAAHQAIALCLSADRLAEAASALPIADEHRLFALLEEREVIMQDLAEQLTVLQNSRPTADSALLTLTEQMVDEADALVADVCAALRNSRSQTVLLAGKVARRVSEIRHELNKIQRASQASVGYAAAPIGRLVDRLR